MFSTMLWDTEKVKRKDQREKEKEQEKEPKICEDKIPQFIL